MPELPEVETVVRGIRPRTVGRRIQQVRCASPLMARTDQGSFARRLRGRLLERLDRHGKWMFFRLDGGDVLVLHLGMTGRLSVEPSDAELLPHTHLRLALDAADEELRFVDPRRFGEILLIGPTNFEERFGPHRLGPEATQITLAQWKEALARTQRRLKAVLLDQRAVAGIGNIYADEILFEARLAPTRQGCTLTEAEIARLHKATRKILAKAIRSQGTSIRDYVDANGVPGEFQKLLAVYGRADQPCKGCGHPVELDRTVVTGRATHWCPSCQPGQ